jgi:hypothetical protein
MFTVRNGALLADNSHCGPVELCFSFELNENALYMLQLQIIYTKTGANPKVSIELTVDQPQCS